MQRWLFRRELAKFAGQPVFYLDECGVDTACIVNMAVRPGVSGFIKLCGKRRERTSIIAASQQGKLVMPLVFQGSCTTEVVDAYFEQVLLPELPTGSVIVLDNARFYQSPTTQRLVAGAGCQLLFLPAYSPDLNPIEHLWAAFKTRLRKDLATAANPFLFIARMSQCYC